MHDASRYQPGYAQVLGVALFLVSLAIQALSQRASPLFRLLGWFTSLVIFAYAGFLLFFG